MLVPVYCALSCPEPLCTALNPMWFILLASIAGFIMDSLRSLSMTSSAAPLYVLCFHTMRLSRMLSKLLPLTIRWLPSSLSVVTSIFSIIIRLSSSSRWMYLSCFSRLSISSEAGRYSSKSPHSQYLLAQIRLSKFSIKPSRVMSRFSTQSIMWLSSSLSGSHLPHFR